MTTMTGLDYSSSPSNQGNHLNNDIISSMMLPQEQQLEQELAEIKKLEEATSTSIKTKAVTPVVNKFGMASPKAINPNSSNSKR